MDGQNRTKLVDSKIVFPHGITLDLVSRLVYWADAYLDYIEVVDYEGKNRQTIIQGLLVSTVPFFQSRPSICALFMIFYYSLYTVSTLSVSPVCVFNVFQPSESLAEGTRWPFAFSLKELINCV